MTTFAKGMIITGVVIVLLVVAAIGGTIYFISRNSGQWFANARESMEEGQRFGRSTDNAGCVAETVTRYKQERGLTAAIKHQLFLNGCLPTSKPTEGFCDNVPRATEFMRAAEWQRERCEGVGMGGDKFCPQIFGSLQSFCERRRARTREDSGN